MTTESTQGDSAAKLKGPDKAQIDAWKKQHGQLLQITVKNGSKSHMAYLRKVKDRNIYAAVLSFSNAGKILEAGEMILNNCKLYADVEIETNEQVAAAAAMAAYHAFEMPEVDVKKI
jgi:hypothetical protein